MIHQCWNVPWNQNPRFNESIGKFALTKHWSCRSAPEYTLWSSHSLRESWKISSLSVWFCDAKHKVWFIAAGFLLLFHVEDICKCMFHWHRNFPPHKSISYMPLRPMKTNVTVFIMVTLYLKNIMFDLSWHYPTLFSSHKDVYFRLYTLHKYVSK